MTYPINLTKKAEKSLNRIPKEYQRRIVNLLISLQENPYLGKPLDGKYKGTYSLRIWPYRIIYEVDRTNRVIYVEKIGHRQGVYR